MKALENYLPDAGSFIRSKCPELQKLMQEEAMPALRLNALNQANADEETVTVITGNPKIRNTTYDKERKTFHAESTVGFDEPRGVITIVSDVIDRTNGRSINGRAVTLKHAHSLTCAINADMSSYRDVDQFKFLVRTVFYWTETDKDGKTVMKKHEERRQYNEGYDIVDNITVEFPNTLKQRDATVILYGRTAEANYDDPDKVYPDVHPQNNQLPVFIPFTGSVRVVDATIVGVKKEDSSLMIEHPVKHTCCAAFAKDKGQNWEHIKWEYFDNKKLLRWTFPEDWKNTIGLQGLSVSSYFDFYADLCLQVQPNSMNEPVDVHIYMGNAIGEDHTHCKIKKLMLQWGCLGKDTMLLMADGTQKKICEINRDDRVSTGKGSARVIAIYSGMEEDIAHIVTESGKKVLATTGHPILTQRGWLRVMDMNAADKVIMADGTSESLAGLYRTPYGDTVYNIELEGDVRQLIADGIVVGDYRMQNQPVGSIEDVAPIKGQEHLTSEFRLLVDEINKSNNWK